MYGDPKTPSSPFPDSDDETLNRQQTARSPDPEGAPKSDAHPKPEHPISSDQNLKCQLELNNGQVTRGANLLKRDSNALVLNTYVGIFGVALFCFDTLFQFDHLILLVHCTLLYFGGEASKEYII